MQVLCDVCRKSPSTVMCCADEACLCSECDTRIHAANKLAGKHQRVPLITSSSDDSTVCDICQEKTGFFFCLQDRALLCRICDLSIHSTNSFTSTHDRFLVPGIRVALHPICPQDHAVPTEALQTTSPRLVLAQTNSSRTGPAHLRSPMDGSTSTTQQTSNLALQTATQQTLSLASHPATQQTTSSGSAASSRVQDDTRPAIVPQSVHSVSVPSRRPQADLGVRPKVEDVQSGHVNGAGLSVNPYGSGNIAGRSSISQYLTETLPGWRVDELLNFPDMAAAYCFADIGSSKADTPTSGDLDWTADVSFFDEQILAESVAEVPSIPMPSPPTASGFLRSGRAVIGKARPDSTILVGFGDTLVVPDLGGQSSPIPSPTSPPPPPLKRRRAFVEF